MSDQTTPTPRKASMKKTNARKSNEFCKEQVLKINNTNKFEFNSVCNANCIEFMKNIPDASVDLIIADPPYFQVWGDFDFVWESEEEYLEWIYSCLREFHRVLKPDGTLMLWGTFKRDHETLAEIIVWNKRNKLFKKKGMITQRNCRGPGVKNNYMSTREDLLFYTKSDDYTFHVPCLDEKTNRKDKGANGKERKNKRKRVSDVWYDIAEASQSSIERCFHPTTKAQKLCNRIITTHSNENDLVFIPFMGSGSEIISCIKNGRQFIGTELDKDYFVQSIGRIKKFCPKLKIEGLDSCEKEANVSD